MISNLRHSEIGHFEIKKIKKCTPRALGHISKSGEPYANPAGVNHFIIGDLDWLRCELFWVVGAERWFDFYENTT